MSLQEVKLACSRERQKKLKDYCQLEMRIGELGLMPWL